MGVGMGVGMGVSGSRDGKKALARFPPQHTHSPVTPFGMVEVGGGMGILDMVLTV